MHNLNTTCSDILKSGTENSRRASRDLGSFLFRPGSLLCARASLASWVRSGETAFWSRQSAMCNLQEFPCRLRAPWAHPRTDDMGAQDASKRAWMVAPVATVNGNPFPASLRRPILQPPHGVGALGNGTMGRARHADRARCRAGKGRNHLPIHHSPPTCRVTPAGVNSRPKSE